jgi:hypothetical protein
MKQFNDTRVRLEIPCDSTVDGTCSKVPTVDQCIEKCKPPACYWGTYSTADQTCMPIQYSTHRNLNPGFLFHPSKGMITFADTSFFEFPADRKNRLFFYDRVRIQNVETGIILPPDVTFRLTRPYLPHPGLDFIPITSRTPVLLYDRTLDSVLRVEGSQVNWYKAIDFLNQDYEAFFFEPTTIPDPKEFSMNINPLDLSSEKSLYYSDVFHIRTAQNEHLSFPPMYRQFQPRLNDLIISTDIYKLPNVFRFIYIPSPVIYPNNV